VIVRDLIPGRPTWELGTPRSAGHGWWLVPVSHVETGYSLWAEGANRASWTADAIIRIDAVLEVRWQAMAELIEEGDFYGPNVWVLAPTT